MLGNLSHGCAIQGRPLKFPHAPRFDPRRTGTRRLPLRSGSTWDSKPVPLLSKWGWRFYNVIVMEGGGGDDGSGVDCEGEYAGGEDYAGKWCGDVSCGGYDEPDWAGVWVGKCSKLCDATGINFSADFADVTNFIRIQNRATDLHKIAAVNSISRAITAEEISINEALGKLNDVDQAQLTFPYWMQIIAAAFVSGSFAIMFGGTWPDFIPAFVAGGVGYAAMVGAGKLVEVSLSRISLHRSFWGSWPCCLSPTGMVPVWIK